MHELIAMSLVLKSWRCAEQIHRKLWNFTLTKKIVDQKLYFLQTACEKVFSKAPWIIWERVRLSGELRWV